MDHILLLLGLAVGVTALLLAAALGGERRGWWVAAVALVAASALGRLVGHGALGLGLGAVGELAALGLVAAAGTPESRAAARTWGLALVPAIVAVGLGYALTDLGHARPAGLWGSVAVGLFVLGYALKLALVPLYFWLPKVARAASATSLVLILGIVDVGVFADLAGLRDIAPWIFTEHSALWTSLAVISLLGGALLAVAETDLKAIVALTGIAHSGMLLLGVIAPDAASHTGVAVGLLGHAFAVTALFGAVACAETFLGRAPSIADTRGLAGRLPVPSAVFMIGAGALVGLPPSLAFSADWRLFGAAWAVGGAAMVGLAFLAAAIVFLVMVRALHRVWLGPSEEAAAGGTPTAARAVLIAVALAIAVGGIVPRLFEPTPAAPLALALTDGDAR